MGIIIRQSFINSIAILIGIVLGVLNRIFFYPIALSEAEIGLVQIITSISIILSQLGLYGFSSTITKYYSDFKSKNILPNFLGFTFVFSTILFLIIFSIYFFFKDIIISKLHPEMRQVTQYTWLILIISGSGMYIHLLNSISYNNLKTTFPSTLNNIVPKAITLIALWITSINLIDFHSFLNLYTLSNVIIFSFLAIYVLKFLKEKIYFNPLKTFSKPNIKTLKYSSYVYFGALTTIISQSIDSLMISSMNGLAQTGIYSIAFFMGVIIEMPKRALNSITIPIISLNWTKGLVNEIKKIYTQTSINQGIIGILFFLLLLFSINEIFNLIPNNEKYISGKNVALIIGLSKVIDIAFGANAEILKTSPKYKWDFILISFFIIISICSNLILIPIFGINGAAVATFTSILLYNISRFFIIKYYFKIQPFTTKSIYLFSIFIVLGGLSVYINHFITTPPSNLLYNVLLIILKSGVLAGIYCFITFKLNISQEWNSMVNKIIKKIKYLDLKP